MEHKDIIRLKGSLFFFTDVEADQAVVFFADSGDTHLIDQLSASLLKKIGEQPKTKVALVKYGMDLLNEVSINEVETFVDNWQTRFENMELIEVGEEI